MQAGKGRRVLLAGKVGQASAQGTESEGVESSQRLTCKAGQENWNGI